MTNLLKRLTGVGALVVVALGASPAFAAGADTNAGTIITNTASISYAVNSVTGFSANSNADYIPVDRKVQFAVAEATPTGTTSVTPGQTGRVTTFTVTNTTNGALDIRIAAANLASGAQSNVHGGSVTDAFDVTNFAYYVETGAAAGLQTTGPSADTLLVASGGVFWIDEVAEDAVKTVYVLADIPTTVTNSQISAISLTGIGALPGGTGVLGAVLTDDSAAANNNTTTGGPPPTSGTVQNVFNDAAGTETGDAAKDNKHSARDSYTVAAPTLTVSKISWVIDDPVNLTVNPKAIPGATVGYCITVTNSGAQAADTVSINDVLPAEVNYVASSVQVINAGPSGGTCSGTGAGGSTTGTPVTSVQGNLGTVDQSGGTNPVKSVWFKVTIK